MKNCIKCDLEKGLKDIFIEVFLSLIKLHVIYGNFRSKMNSFIFKSYFCLIVNMNYQYMISINFSVHIRIEIHTDSTFFLLLIEIKNYL